MEKVRLGKTNLSVSRSSFGAIPIQRLSDEDSTALLRAAFDGGMNFFDTARIYTSSERKIGLAFSNMRDSVIIATKSQATTAEKLFVDVETSLSQLNTAYVDILQFHNPAFIPCPGGEDGLYDAALKLKAEGKIRHIGITSHRLPLAVEMVKSGLFETMQYPMSSLASDEEVELVRLCQRLDVGFIAMKGMAGGLITSARSTFAFIHSLGYPVPIWGIQYRWQLDEFLELEKNPPVIDAEITDRIMADRRALAGEFCRSCGYCQPCPVGINIAQAARMRLLLGRVDWRTLVDEQNREMMEQTEKCVGCGACTERCPYNLPVRKLLRENLDFYRAFYDEHRQA